MLNFFGGNSPERRVERLIAKGEHLFQHGREREGLKKFTEAAKVLPEAAKPSLYLGRAYVKLKDYDLALKHYYKALYFCNVTEEPGMLGEIAQIYFYLKRYDLVEEKLKKILQLDLPLLPAQTEKIQHAVIKGLAHLYLRTGRISDAIAQQELLLEHAPEDVQVIQMLAESYRDLGEYHEARVLLQKAIELAQYSCDDADLEQLTRKLRAVGFPDGTEFGIKEQLYAEYGSICLGTAGDHGIEIVTRQTLAPLALNELIVTLRRLREFIQAFTWPITCIVTADKNSSLLAAMMTHLLNVPIKPVARVANHDQVFACQLLFQESKPVKQFLKKLRRRADAIITFALVALVNNARQEYLPDIIGIPVENPENVAPKNSNPTFGEPPESGTSEKFIQQLLEMFYEIPEEEHRAQQIAYYLTQPIQLRDHLVPGSEPRKASTDRLEQKTPEELVNQLCSNKKAAIFEALQRIRRQDFNDPAILATLKTLYVEKRDAAIRRIVGEYLLTTGGAEGLTYLLDLFQQPTTDVLLKTSILDTLSLSSNRKIARVLIAALRDPHADLRLHAVEHLEKLDLALELTDLFERLLTDTPPIIVKTIAYLMTCETTPAYSVLQQFLPNLLHHADPAVVHASLDAIQFHDDSTFTPLVITLLTHADQPISEHAIRTIGVIGDIDSGYRLLPFLEHPSPNFRYAAAESLTKLDHRRSIVFLMEWLRKETPEVQAKLLKLLGEIGSPEMVPFIVQFAEQHFEQPQLVSAAVQTLARLQDARSLPFVRKAVATFPEEALLTPYISLAGTIGEEQDLETLVTLLESPPAVQFRVAAVLYQHGLKRYFHILQDGIRSKKIPINLLAIEILGEIGDELSVQEMFAVFKRQQPRLDQKIAEVICRYSTSRDYYTVFRNLPPAEAEMVIQGIQRAISGSKTVPEVINALDSFCGLRQFDAIPVIQQLCATATNRVILCGAMKCLARYDPTGSQDLIKNHLHDEDLEVANTAYVIMRKLKTYGFADE